MDTEKAKRIYFEMMLEEIEAMEITDKGEMLEIMKGWASDDIEKIISDKFA